MFKALIPLLFAIVSVQASAAAWHVSSVPDDMRGSVMKVAQLKAVTGTGKPLTLALTEEGGRRTAMLTAGIVFDCPQTCSIAVRFDGGRVEYWDAARKTPGNFSILTLEQSEAFYRRISGAQSVKMVVEVYGAGEQQYTFEVPAVPF